MHVVSKRVSTVEKQYKMVRVRLPVYYLLLDRQVAEARKTGRKPPLSDLIGTFLQKKKGARQ